MSRFEFSLLDEEQKEMPKLVRKPVEEESLSELETKSPEPDVSPSDDEIDEKVLVVKK